MSIGERIITLRKDAGLSQSELAKILNVSRQAVSKWETDQSAPDSLKLIQLAEVLNTDIEYLTVGRRNLGRRPPVVLKTTETIEKIVEKPVIQYVDRIIEKEVEKPVIQYIEKPIVKKVFRTKYVQDPKVLFFVSIISFSLGFLFGVFF